jgi:hypothetical protein
MTVTWDVYREYRWIGSVDANSWRGAQIAAEERYGYGCHVVRIYDT